MLDEGEEIVAVIYHETNGAWYPHSIRARGPCREWVYGVPRSEQPRLPGYYGDEYDASYSKADDVVYVYNSGGGGDGNEVYVGKYAEAERMPARIWLHPEAVLVDHEESDGERRKVTIDRTDLASRGYLLLEDLPSDPFEDAVEGKTHWCDACEDNIDADDTFNCAMCTEYGHEHGIGQLFVVMDEAEAGLAVGLYRVKRWPYVLDGMLHQDIYKNAVERIGDVPEGVDADGYPCAHVCDACRASLEAKP